MGGRRLLPFILAVSLSIMCVRVIGSSGDRNLLGSDTVFDAALLEEWGVPLGAELLLQSASSCAKTPPVRVAAKMAVLCDAFEQIRKCMNISETAPFVWGSGCEGTNCTMELLHDNRAAASQCALKHLVGIEVDPGNKTRSSTCGFDPADAYWLKPFRNPSNYGEIACVGSYPTASENLIWAECVDGNPVYTQKMIFEEPPTDGKYTCFDSPQCKDSRRYHSEMVCFKEGTEVPSPVAEVAVNDTDGIVTAQSGADRTVLLTLGFILQIVFAIHWQF